MDGLTDMTVVRTHFYVGRPVFWKIKSIYRKFHLALHPDQWSGKKNGRSDDEGAV